jgi:hypothetical protein
MKVLNGICSLEPLAVLNRLHRRKTSTMITTHRRAVLTVEFKGFASYAATRMLRACHVHYRGS